MFIDLFNINQEEEIKNNEIISEICLLLKNLILELQ